MDSIPEMHDLTLNHPSRFTKLRSGRLFVILKPLPLLGRVLRRPSANKATNALCSNCDLAQQRILSYVTSFDPDDNVSSLSDI